jgi:hypothetical protein
MLSGIIAYQVLRQENPQTIEKVQAVLQMPLHEKECGCPNLVLILSESSRIKLDKAGKTAGLQRSKTLDISSRNRKPWKGLE